MTTPLSVFTLLAKESADTILAAALEVARLVGLPVDTWRVGDPTRTQLRALAKKLESVDDIRAEFAKASFITGPVDERAQGDWLSLRVRDVYGVEREEDTFSTPTVTLDNAGGGLYELAPRALTVLASGTGATFVNVSNVTINPLATGVVVSLEAEEGGSAGSVGADEIDTIVSPTLTGVTIAGSEEGVGIDEQSDEGLIEQALATLGALSPNGPVDAYEFVVRNSDLTGIEGITRAFADGDSADGTVTVYAATTTTALDGDTVTALQEAVDVWAQPLCSDATVVSGTPQAVAITIGNVPAAGQGAAIAAISAYMASVDFESVVVRDAIASAVRVALNDAGFTISPSTPLPITNPAVDVELATGVFPVAGAITFA